MRLSVATKRTDVDRRRVETEEQARAAEEREVRTFMAGLRAQRIRVGTCTRLARRPRCWALVWEAADIRSEMPIPRVMALDIIKGEVWRQARICLREKWHRENEGRPEPLFGRGPHPATVGNIAQEVLEAAELGAPCAIGRGAAAEESAA